MEKIKKPTETEPFPVFPGLWLKTDTFRTCGVTWSPIGESQNCIWHRVKTNLRETVKRAECEKESCRSPRTMEE